LNSIDALTFLCTPQRVPTDLQNIAPPSAPPLETTRVAYELGEQYPDQASFYNLVSGELKFTVGATPDSEFLRANRARLRQWMATDLKVSWGKRFVRHTIEIVGAETKVTAYFDDGTSTTGDFLIGADGASSPVGTGLRPEGDNLHVLPVAMVAGELTLDTEQSARMQGLGKISFGGGTNDCFLFVGLRSVTPDKSKAVYYWLFQWRDETIPQVGREHWTFKASKAKRLSFVREKLTQQQAHQRLREIVDLQCEEGEQGSVLDSFLIRDRVPTPGPGNAPITLIGDSAHAMPPYRAQGANMACSDAFTLGRLIVDEVAGAAETFNAQKIIREYEKEMIPRATSWVFATRAVSENFDSGSVDTMRKPATAAS
jgi:2-polyprenyl-6-methoxyphenol hydroxylase-like FAD-dependent oxidoreductase